MRGTERTSQHWSNPEPGAGPSSLLPVNCRCFLLQRRAVLHPEVCWWHSCSRGVSGMIERKSTGGEGLCCVVPQKPSAAQYFKDLGQRQRFLCSKTKVLVIDEVKTSSDWGSWGRGSYKDSCKYFGHKWRAGTAGPVTLSIWSVCKAQRFKMC